jgi:hypothetical protein
MIVLQKASEVQNIGNRQSPPSACLPAKAGISAPEECNIGSFAFNYQYCTPLMLLSLNFKYLI